MGLYSERLQGVLVCSSFFLSSIYLCQAAFSLHSPATYISHSCRCKEQWADWMEDNLHSRTSLVKLQPVVQGVLLEGGVRQAQAFKWPAGEPLIWAPFSCVGGRQIPKRECGKGEGGVVMCQAERCIGWAQVLDPGMGFSLGFVKGKSHMSPSCTWESKWFTLSLAKGHLGLKLVTHAPT